MPDLSRLTCFLFDICFLNSSKSVTRLPDAATLNRLSVSACIKDKEVRMPLAQPDGFEPSLWESKSHVLPLHQSRMFKPHIYQSPYGRRTESKNS